MGSPLRNGLRKWGVLRTVFFGQKTKSRNEALEAVASRDEIVPVEEAVLAEVKEAREKRAKAA